MTGPRVDAAVPATEVGRFALSRHRVVNAGAGTGKTHALLTQYLHLIAGFSAPPTPLEPRAIAALTFTEKAAAEMRERVGRRLLALVRADGSPALLAAKEPDLYASAAALGRSWPSPRHFESARAQLAMAPIGTFHSFASALLRRHAISAGIAPDFDLLDEETARDLLGEACERAVLAGLDGEGGERVAHDTGELVTEFGFAGDHGLVAALCRLQTARGEESSGAASLRAAYENAALDAERAWLHDQLKIHLQPLFALSPELSEKSAERVAHAQLLFADLHRALLSLDSFARATSLLTELRTALRHVRSGREDLQQQIKASHDLLKSAEEHAEALLVSLRAAPLAHAMDWLLQDCRRRYEEAKRVLSALDFADLLRKSRDLLRDDVAVRSREQARFAVLLVDEFQDTSPLQAEILSLLITDTATSGSAPHGESRGRPLYIVGDRKQSIYGFRGADVAAYEAVCQRLLAAGADEETLQTSHRSRPALIEFTNTLFARVFDRSQTPAPLNEEIPGSVDSLLLHAGRVSWDEARDSLRAAREDVGRPLVELLGSLHPNKQPAASPPSQEIEPPAEPTASDDTGPLDDDPIGREALWIAQRIHELLSSGTQAKHIVLLLRRFTHLLRYTGALTQAGIPYYVVRGRGFFAAQEVLDLASFLALLDDPHDRLALLAVLRSPLCALSDDSLVQLQLSGLLGLDSLLRVHAQSQPSDAMNDPGPLAHLPLDEHQRLTVLLSLLSLLRGSAARVGPAACLQAAIDHTDYLAILCADGGGSGASLGQQRVANVQRLQERAAAHEARGGTLASFVRALKQSTDPRVASGYGEGDDPLAPISGESDDVVRVMTIHQSKGLEFPVVFVAGCASPERSESPAISYDPLVGLGLRVWQSDARISGVKRGGKRMPTLAARRIHVLSRARALAESARLFYVAATRASERLIFVGESKRTSSGTWRAHLDALAADHPDVLRVVLPNPELPPMQHTAPSSPEPMLAADSPVLARAADAQVHLAYSPLQLSTVPSGFSLTISAAADLWVCPRRYQLRHRFLLHESDPAMPAAATDDPAGELPLAQLATSLLTREDLSLLRTSVTESLLVRGHDLRTPTLAELATRLQRFLATPLIDRVLSPASPPLRRAVSFDVPLASLRIRDSFDWVIGARNAPETKDASLYILRFRYGYSPDATSALSRAQGQLLAWAAQTFFGAQPAVHTAFCDLREPHPVPRFLPAACSAREEQVLVAMAQEREAVLQKSPSVALALPRLPRHDCDAMRCGYRYLCWNE